MKSYIYNLFKILLSEYLREFVGKNVEKPEYPIPFSLSFSLSGFTGPLPHFIESELRSTPSPTPQQSRIRP
jgi:hypothetical protein